jgi:hypothetical protein
MAVTRASRSILMTAQGDSVTGRFHVVSMMLKITGGTPGTPFEVQETSGAIVARGVVEAAEQYLEILPGACPTWLDGIKFTVAPTGSELLIRYD